MQGRVKLVVVYHLQIVSGKSDKKNGTRLYDFLDRSN